MISEKHRAASIANLRKATAVGMLRLKAAIKTCPTCGCEFKCKQSHAHYKRYCSAACMATAYKGRLTGANNPNWKDAGKRTCEMCGVEFKAYAKDRKYCSLECAHKVKRAGRLVPMRGKANYATRKDDNHAEIFAKLREGCFVFDCSPLGGGFPDGIAWVSKSWQLFDVKNPKTAYGRRGLNPLQKKWANQWPGGPVFLIYTPEEAERFSKGEFSGLKREPPDRTTLEEDLAGKVLT